MTTPGPLWNPRTEGELRAALADGLLEENHYLDLKRTVDPGKSANKKIACDIAAFALDGGTVAIGIDEGDADTPMSLWPIDLTGLPERIESIAATAVNEPVRVTSTVIAADGQQGKGYLIVHVPQSSRGPHMVDGRYYGRGDKENRVLSNEEVLRAHELRLVGHKDMLDATRTAIAGLGPRKGRDSILAILAEPLGAPEDLLVPLVESAVWHQTVLDLMSSVANLGHTKYAPTLTSATGFARRASAVALTTGMFGGQRWEGEDRAAELAFHENGTLFLASERAVCRYDVGGASSRQSSLDVIFDDLIVGNVDLVVRMAAAVAQRFGFAGTWRFGLIVTGLRGHPAWSAVDRFFGSEGEHYSAKVYERATEATLLDLTASPRTTAKALVAPLLRSLGTYRAADFTD
ncbi:AlbA family DNA-binding domain-containing protein [Nocardia takedensis]